MDVAFRLIGDVHSVQLGDMGFHYSDAAEDCRSRGCEFKSRRLRFLGS